MKVYGFEISDDTIKIALTNMGKSSFTAQILERQLIKEGVPKHNNKDYIAVAAASRIISNLKKEGKIKKVYGGGQNTLYDFIKL